MTFTSAAVVTPASLPWRSCQGSEAGVTTAAEVNVNFYLIDTAEGVLLQRSHFEEKQKGLAENLLTMPAFIKRGGKWVTAQDLASEAVSKMIKEFGL